MVRNGLAAALALGGIATGALVGCDGVKASHTTSPPEWKWQPQAMNEIHTRPASTVVASGPT